MICDSHRNNSNNYTCPPYTLLLFDRECESVQPSSPWLRRLSTTETSQQPVSIWERKRACEKDFILRHMNTSPRFNSLGCTKSRDSVDFPVIALAESSHVQWSKQHCYSRPLGRWVLKYRSFFIFFSPSRMCILIIGFPGWRDVFFFFASKFNSEMQAMFCGRILPSLYSFPCGSDFC